MQDDVKLTSIEFSTHKYDFVLASVKVSYSDGSSSPNFGYEVPVAVIEDYMYCAS